MHAMYSAALGILNARLAVAYSGAVGMMVGVSSVGVVASAILVFSSTGGVVAATSAMRAPANAGTATSDSSVQSAACMTMVSPS